MSKEVIGSHKSVNTKEVAFLAWMHFFQLFQFVLIWACWSINSIQLFHAFHICLVLFDPLYCQSKISNYFCDQNYYFLYGANRRCLFVRVICFRPVDANTVKFHPSVHSAATAVDLLPYVPPFHNLVSPRVGKIQWGTFGRAVQFLLGVHSALFLVYCYLAKGVVYVELHLIRIIYSILWKEFKYKLYHWYSNPSLVQYLNVQVLLDLLTHPESLWITL